MIMHGHRIAILVGASFGDAKKLIHHFEHLSEYLASHTCICVTNLVEQLNARIAFAGAKVILVKHLIIIKVGKYVNANAPAVIQLLA